MDTSEKVINRQLQVSIIIDSLVDLINNPKEQLKNNTYYYHTNERKSFLISIYLFKLMICKKNYLIEKYNYYRNHIRKYQEYDIKKVSDLESENELELLLSVKDKCLKNSYHYDLKNEKIIIGNNYVKYNWLISFLVMILDKSYSNKNNRFINICYAIPNSHVPKLNTEEEIDDFLKEFTFYEINIKSKNYNKSTNLLIVKNAAINYLKHLKHFKQGLETEESSQIFYNLLKNECHKQDLIIEEKNFNLLECNETILEEIKENIDDNFLNFPLSKQVHIIENIIWQSGNDINTLEQINDCLDDIIDFISKLKVSKIESNFYDIKEANSFNEIDILQILITYKFLNSFLNLPPTVDYSLLKLGKIKPKYMSTICDKEEYELKSRIKILDTEFLNERKKLEEYKNIRQSINKKELGEDKYFKELEKCVGNINRSSINIATINAKIASLSKQYEDIINDKKSKYKDYDKYSYNYSILMHICNSILGCNYYLKTNNKSSLLNNIIVFEDFEKADNAFYLEITFKDLLKISNPQTINSIIIQCDLPKEVSIDEK